MRGVVQTGLGDPREVPTIDQVEAPAVTDEAVLV